MLYVPVIDRTGEHRKRTPLEFTARRTEDDAKEVKAEQSRHRPPRPTTSRKLEAWETHVDTAWKRFVAHGIDKPTEGTLGETGAKATEYTTGGGGPPQWDTLQTDQELMQSWNEERRDDRMSGTTTPTSSRR